MKHTHTHTLMLCFGASLLAITQLSAKFKGYEFNGNLNGFQDLQYNGDTVGNGTNRAQTNMRKSHTWAKNGWLAAISARKISFNTNEGGRLRSWKSFSNGKITGRVRCSGNDAKNTWGAFWLWTEQRGNKNWEIDMMELTPQGNQNNVYVSDDQTRPGAKFTNPNSLGWRNSMRDYFCNFSSTKGYVFFNNGGSTHGTSQGRRDGLRMKISLQNRPFAFSVHHGRKGPNGKYFAELNCDFIRINYN